MKNEPQSDRQQSQSGGTNTYYSGSEPFFAAYIQCQVYLGSVRLTLDERIAYSVSDLASQLESARRSFIHTGDAVAAISDALRIASQFDQRAAQWERDATARENSKTTQSGEKIHRMKSEHARVRGKIQHTQRTFTKLHVELHQLASEAHFEDEEDVGAVECEVDSKVAVENRNVSVSTTETREFVRNRMGKLMGEGIVFDRDQANLISEGEPEGFEQPVDVGIDVFAVFGWYIPTDVERKNAKRLDARLWLIPKSVAALDALVAECDQLNVSVLGHALEIGRGFWLLEKTEFPKSTKIVSFLRRLREKRFGQDQDSFSTLVLKLNDLGPKQTQLQVRFDGVTGEDVKS